MKASSGLLWRKGRQRQIFRPSGVGAIPSGLISGHLRLLSPIFTTDALPATTLPLHPGLGQAPNILACIPSGVSVRQTATQNLLIINGKLILSYSHTERQTYKVQ